MYTDIQAAHTELEKEIHRLTATYQAQLQQAQINFQNKLLKATYGIDIQAEMEKPTQTEVEFALDLEIHDD